MPAPIVSASDNERGQSTSARAQAAGLESKTFSVASGQKNSDFFPPVVHRLVLVSKSPDTIREQVLSVVVRVLRQLNLQPKLVPINGNNLMVNGKRLCLMSRKVLNNTNSFSVSINDQMPLDLYHRVIGQDPLDVTSLDAELHSISQQDMAAAVQACGNFQLDTISQVEASTYE